MRPALYHRTDGLSPLMTCDRTIAAGTWPGVKIYIRRKGCYACHSQIGAQFWRMKSTATVRIHSPPKAPMTIPCFGVPNAPAQDMPDWARKYSDDWHVAHFGFNPRDVIPISIILRRAIRG